MIPIELSDVEQARLQAAIEEIAAAFVARFPQTVQQPRIVGREAEYPVVDAKGRTADVRRLWDALAQSGNFRAKYDSGRENLLVALEGDDYSYALEVGIGTVEINTRPSADLASQAAMSERAVRALVHAAAGFGWQVLGYGIQPVIRPQLAIMSPKQRYQSLYRAMGEAWLWYTVTASDQIQIDIGRDELLHMLNYANLITPVIIALCANSPVYGARLSPFCSGREGRMAQIHADEHRHGMPARPYRSIADYVAMLAQSTYLILRADNEVVPSSQTFQQYLVEHGVDFDAFLFHEHYVWNSARLRVAYGTVEIRPACQQPWPEHMAAMALSLGLIEASEAINSYIQEVLGVAYWDTMRGYHTRVIAGGLAAPQPAPDFLHTIAGLAEDGLRSRSQGEEQFMEPLWQRLARRENPAQRARRVFQVDGLAGLLALTAIRPGML